MTEWSDYFEYDEKSKTCLVWKIDFGWNGRAFVKKAGTTAGGTNGNLSWQVKINKKLYWCHRIIWEMFNGVIPKGLVIHHKNRNHKDNRISNLELISETIQAIRREKYKKEQQNDQ